MKEETKKKLCKISKIVGFVITFGFAVFGALCAAMLISNGSKKDDIKTLDSSLVQNEVRSERNIKPRKAPYTEGAYNYMESATLVDNVDSNLSGATHSDSFSTAVVDLPNGFYFCDSPISISFGVRIIGFDASYSKVVSFMELAKLSNHREAYPDGFNVTNVIVGDLKDGFYFYWKGGAVSLCEVPWIVTEIYMVDTMDIPTKNVVNFPSNWSPMALISDNLSIKGGYAFVDVSPATYQTLVPITISLKQNLFRYDGKVYDEMVFTFVDLSHGDGYIQDDGQPWKPWEKSTSQLSSSVHVFGLYSLRFNASFSGESIVALSPIYSDSPFQTGGDGTHYPPTVYLPTGEYRWVNPKVTYIEFIDTSFGSGSTRYDGRYSDYTDLDLLIYLNGFLSEGNYLAIGASGGVFDLLSGAFNGLLPILNVQVLPNITFGLLLFLPLIGAIIVIIIRVVKK